MKKTIIYLAVFIAGAIAAVVLLKVSEGGSQSIYENFRTTYCYAWTHTPTNKEIADCQKNFRKLPWPQRYGFADMTPEGLTTVAERQKNTQELIASMRMNRENNSERDSYVEQCMRRRIAAADAAAQNLKDKGFELPGAGEVRHDDVEQCRREFTRQKNDQALREKYAEQ